MKRTQQLDPLDAPLELYPESKLELVAGQLFAGNGLAGSRLLLYQILRGWGAEAAVALGTSAQWVEALCAAYELAPPATASLDQLAEQAAAIAYQVPDLSAGDEGPNAGHWQTASHLRLALHQASEELGGTSLGRDFVMRLGEDGLTPDLLFFNEQKRRQLYEYYLDAPADLVIEIVRPAHLTYDREVKRELYARGGVPEYVLINPGQRAVEFFRLVKGDYQLTPPDADGKYRPQSVPGLAIDVDSLWVGNDQWHSDQQPFIVEQPMNKSPKLRSRDDGVGWGDLPFAPRFNLQPVKIRFDEYSAWGPEAKFEWADGKPDICGRPGIRNITGMLAMTFGLIEVCRLAPPAAWIAAFISRADKEARSQHFKDAWWQKANEIAALLRNKYKLEKIAVTGDLLASQPLDFWSELSLVGWGLRPEEWHNVWRDVSVYEDEAAPEINVFDAGDRYFKRQAEVANWELVEL